MKKILALSAIVLVIVVGITVSTNKIETINQTKEVNVSDEETVDTSISYEYEKQFTLDEIVNLSSNIVVGKIDSIVEFNDSTNIYRVLISRNSKGDADTIIDLYGPKNIYSLNSEYLLFLEFSENVFYENKIYRSIADGVYELSDDKFGDFKVFETNLSGEISDISDFIQWINHINLDINANKAASGIPFIRSNDISDIIDNSVLVAEVIPIKKMAANKNVGLYSVTLEEAHLGSISSKEFTVQLPPNINLNERYLVFLNKSGENDYALSSTGGIISTTNVMKYQEALKEVLSTIRE